MIQDDIRAIAGFVSSLLVARFVLNDIPRITGLTSNPSSIIEVYYDSPETEKEVKSAPGLLEFITSYVSDLGLKHSSTPKHIDFSADMDVVALHVWGRIEVYSRVAELWIKDRVATERALRHILAHEYGHYLITVRHEKIPLPKGPKWKEARKEWVENYSKEFAEKESGISEDEAAKILEDLTRKFGE